MNLIPKMGYVELLYYRNKITVTVDLDTLYTFIAENFIARDQPDYINI